MNRPGKLGDNNHMESFFGSMKAEKFHGRTFNSERELRRVLGRYIDVFYNTVRTHSALGHRSPAAYETMAA